MFTWEYPYRPKTQLTAENTTKTTLNKMKPSSLFRISLLSSTALLISANNLAPPSPHLPPSLDSNRPPLPDTTLRTITLTTTPTPSTLLPPSAPRPPLADSTNHLDILADVPPAPAAPPAPPAITPPPDAAAAITDDSGDSGDDGWQTGIDANGKLFRFRQTTYYSCVTQKTASHCGWHRPIVEISGAPGAGDDGGRVWGFGAKAAVAVGAAVGVVVVGW